MLLKKTISPVHRRQTASQQDELRSFHAVHLKEIENNAKIELSRIDKIATEVENRILEEKLKIKKLEDLVMKYTLEQNNPNRKTTSSLDKLKE